MKRVLNVAGSVLGIAALVILAAVLLLTIGGPGEGQVAQEPRAADTSAVSSQPPPATPTVVPYPPPPTPTSGPYPSPSTPTVVLPPTPTTVPTPVVTPPVPVPTVVPIPVPPAILEGEKIAFLSGNNLHLINVTSRAVAPVTASSNVTALFGWSWDGSKMLLGVGERPVLPETDMAGGTDLWVLDVREGRAVQLTQGLEVRSAAWSPVSDKIAYVVRDDGLHIVNSDGTGLKKVADKAIAYNPVWSPDGMRITFILPPPAWEGGLVEMYDIAVLNLADGSIAQLTSEAWTNFHPVWSLDGKRILFESDREHAPGTGLWYTMNADGSGLRHLEKPTLLSSMNVDKSPIADLVAYEVSGNVWVMNFEGDASRIAEGFDPSWSPDGSNLAYVGTDGGIWMINVDGTGPEKLSDAGSQPHWSD